MHFTYPENPVSIGDHIRKKRIELKLHQKDVAKICGVTEDSITNWEKNRSKPKIQFLPHIIKFLGYAPFEVDMTTYQGKLKAYRYKNGLTHAQIGKIFDFNASTIGAWENGKHAPMKNELKKLQQLLKMHDK